MTNNTPDPGDLNSNPKTRNQQLDPGHKNLVILVYALQAAGLFTGFTVFIALIINYVKKEDVEGTIAESHFRWQIRTFWYGLLWSVIGFATYLLIVGYFVLFAATLWFIYRFIKGLYRISSERPMYQ